MSMYQDIRDVQHGEDLAARRQHLADVGDTILQPTVARRHQVVVLDVDDGEPDVMLGCFQRALGLSNPFGGGSQSGISAVERLLALIEQFLSGKARLFFGDTRIRSSSCAAKGLLRVCAAPVGVGLVDGTLRLLDLGVALAELLLQISGVHASNHLPRLDHVADLGVQLNDPAWKFGVDIDLVGLQPAVAESLLPTGCALRVLPPTEAGTSAKTEAMATSPIRPQSSPVPGRGGRCRHCFSCLSAADARSHF